MSWLDTQKTMLDEGYSAQEIEEAQQSIRKQMFDEGYQVQEIDEAFGIPQFDRKAVDKHFEENFKAYQEQQARDTATVLTPEANDYRSPEAKEADGFIESFEAGFQMSTMGLLARGKRPDIFVSENSGMFYRIAEQIGTLVGDIPAMIAGGVAGGVAGGAAGSAVPVVGNALGGVIGGGAGGFALPSGMRKILIDKYEKGEIQNFNDFWERASAAFIEAAKGGIVGAATSGVGGVASKLAGGVINKSAAKMASEVATMVTVGSALEGQVPDMEHFAEAAIVVGLMHGATSTFLPGEKAPKIKIEKVEKQLRKNYVETGVHPAEQAAAISADPILKQEHLAENPEQTIINEKLSGEPGTKPKIEEIVPEKSKEAREIEAIESEIEVERAAKERLKPEEEVITAEEVKTSEKMSADDIMGGTIVEKTPLAKEKYSWSKFYTDFVDRLNPINEAVKRLVKDPKATLEDIANPYNLARMANDFRAKLKYFVEKGALSYKDGARVEGVKNFWEIVKPFKKDPGFEKFLVSNRVLELNSKGIKAFGKKTTINGVEVTHDQIVKSAREISKRDKAKYGEAAKEITNWSNSVLKYAYEAGRLDKATYEELIKANKAYVPFARVLDAMEGGTGFKSDSLKKLSGSEKLINRPLLAMIDNAETLLRFAETNRARYEMLRLAAKNGEIGEGKMFEAVEAKTRKIEVSEKELARHLAEQGIEATPEAMDIYRKQGKLTLAANEFEVWLDGKREIFRTDKELATALRAIDGDVTSQNMLMKLFRGFTTVKKVGVALTPDFILRNVFRDQFSKQAFGGGFPIWDLAVAMGDIIAKKEPYYNWLKSGGANGSFIKTAEIVGDALGVYQKTGLLKSVWNSATHPIQVAAAITENATRLAEFKRVVGREAAYKDVSGNALFKGGFASREVTVDFQRVGAQMSALNSITAFQNVSIQGLDRTIRAGKAAAISIKNDPTSAFTHPFVTGTAMITGASLTLWAINHDQEWYQDIPRWEKDLFWHMQVGETIYRLPKPQELGIMFGSLPERLMETFYADNPDGGKEFASTLLGLVVPSMVPDALAPPIEQMLNRSLFTKNPIVSQGAEKMLPPYQYNDYTSETAKIIGKLVGALPGVRDIGPEGAKLASPMVIENYVRGWTGTMGMYALKTADQGLYAANVKEDIKPESTMADWPFIKAFVSRYPSANAQNIHDFRENFKVSSQLYSTAKMLMESGQGDEAIALLASREEDMMKLTGINESITNMVQVVQRIMANGEITPEEKRQNIDSIYYQMIQLARSGNQLTQEFKDIMKQSKETK